MLVWQLGWRRSESRESTRWESASLLVERVREGEEGSRRRWFLRGRESNLKVGKKKRREKVSTIRKRRRKRREGRERGVLGEGKKKERSYIMKGREIEKESVGRVLGTYI